MLALVKLGSAGWQLIMEGDFSFWPVFKAVGSSSYPKIQVPVACFSQGCLVKTEEGSRSLQILAG